ncbi:carboxypeptidase B2 [Colossoma macropomum]|uniref:carboxypeptidase B2 n=1 Tax=Colossoma macropomum TaxID=42526 RepID=UPI00186446DA|nr:carboxypeptidase B2 [Colossoma macropomum]
MLYVQRPKMRALAFLTFLICFYNIIGRSDSGQNSTEHDQVLSIKAATEEQVNVLKNISSDNQTVLWQPASPRHITAETEVHLYIHSGSVKHVTDLLDKHKITYRVLLENTEELIKQQTRNETADPRSGSANADRYYSLEDIYHWINKTRQEHPEMVEVILIGSSFEKRPLYVMKLSGRRGAVDKAMWMDCGIHAREWISPAFCQYFIRYVLTHYNQFPDITSILDKMDIYVLPVLNPDGYKYTWTTNRMWRKNRSEREDSFCVGVDLNRNFDASWCTEGASSDPCSEIYCGQYPESEPEVNAVAKFLRTHKDTVKLYFSIHSYSQMLLFPYSYTYELAQNHAELLDLVKDASQKIRRFYGKLYRFGAGAKTIYLAPGGSDDWAYNQGIKYSFTFELQDQGKYGFLLPPSLISGACNDALLAVKTIALRALQKIQ